MNYNVRKFVTLYFSSSLFLTLCVRWYSSTRIVIAGDDYIISECNNE